MDRRLSRDRLTGWLLEQLPLRAPTWLAEQRWYGSKTQSISDVEVEDLFWLPAGDELVALVVLQVSLSAGGPRQIDRYAMLVRSGEEPSGRSVIGIVGGEALTEAATEPSPIAALMSGLVGGTPVSGLRGGSLGFADATPRVQRLFSEPSGKALTVVPMGVEQSNTSTRLGTDHVFKLFRRLEAGEHPQLEIGRFLSRAGFRGIPPLEGSVTYSSPDGSRCALATVEGWIENSGDGWHDVVSCLERASRDELKAEELTGRLTALGRSLAAFHEAMASDDSSAEFAPEPVTPDDLRAWRASLRTQYDRTLAIVGRQVGKWQGPAASLARRVLASKAELTAQLEQLEAHLSLGWSKIRIHGDFHLGQTLRTHDGFVVIDFEGEPSKSIAERRRKHSPLKDVAGMLRSVDYAAATITSRGISSTGGPDAAGLRRAFVDAYCAHALTAGAPYLPKTLAALQSWLRFLEFEKALYEVEYEANSRPTWVHIPLTAVDAQMALDHGNSHVGP